MAAMGSDGGGGSGSGISCSGSRARDCNDSRYGGSGADAGHERGSRDNDGSQGTGRSRRTTVVQGRNTGRGGGWKELTAGNEMK